MVDQKNWAGLASLIGKKKRVIVSPLEDEPSPHPESATSAPEVLEGLAEKMAVPPPLLVLPKSPTSRAAGVLLRTLTSTKEPAKEGEREKDRVEIVEISDSPASTKDRRGERDERLAQDVDWTNVHQFAVYYLLKGRVLNTTGIIFHELDGCRSILRKLSSHRSVHYRNSICYYLSSSYGIDFSSEIFSVKYYSLFMDSLKLCQPKPSYSSQPSSSRSNPASMFTPRFAQFIMDAFQELGYHIQEQDLKILSQLKLRGLHMRKEFMNAWQHEVKQVMRRRKVGDNRLLVNVEGSGSSFFIDFDGEKYHSNAFVPQPAPNSQAVRRISEIDELNLKQAILGFDRRPFLAVTSRIRSGLHSLFPFCARPCSSPRLHRRQGKRLAKALLVSLPSSSFCVGFKERKEPFAVLQKP
ncbi:hypothetical protein AXF42_Ash016336 [Apostasia shenzhenica]|uniref:Uncharacterized protein n=1 Tax=Apostasia shenzhenica TaxID=1088818 RepID=A0A2H9ZXH0_9ASPA|nr:hypothetical protein AXF42_Ash016336 [Apostasia shenzhenica]